MTIEETISYLKSLKSSKNDAERKTCLKLSRPDIITTLILDNPGKIPDVLKTLDTPEERAEVMTYQYQGQESFLTLLTNKCEHNRGPLAAVLTCLPAKDRLNFIRQEDSGAQEFGPPDNPEFKHINTIIYCDLYIEHLQASLSEKNLFPPDENYKALTQQKIKAVKNARAILEDRPESEETMQRFFQYLRESKTLLETRRDTWLTFFLKCVGVVCSAGLAYHSLFVNTDGKALLDKIGVEQQLEHKPS